MFSYYVKKYTTPFFIVCFVIFLLSLVLLLLFSLFSPFADAVNLTVAQGVRLVMAKLSSVLALSFAEALICLSPLIVVGLLILFFVRCHTSRQCAHFLANVLGVLFLVGALYVFTLGIGYHTSSLDEKLDLEREKLSADELYRTSEHLLSLLEAELDGVSFDGESGSSVMPYSLDELSARLCREYDLFAEEYDGKQILLFNYDSRVKGVYFSRVMSYAHILGIYTFWSGESNVNVDYPDVELPSTAAHELAHQRGISREDEANFVAFLITTSSSDAYIRYSGLLDIFRYVSNALYTADPERYYELLSTVDSRILGELRAISRHAKQYEGNTLGQISTDLNDVYLKANGTEGSVSYGLVVDLTVAYYKQQMPQLFE